MAEIDHIPSGRCRFELFVIQLDCEQSAPRALDFPRV